MSAKNMAKANQLATEEHMDTKRVFFQKFDQVMKLPDLIEVQTSSYKWFFDEGLKELFNEINPSLLFSVYSLRSSFLATSTFSKSMPGS